MQYSLTHTSISTLLLPTVHRVVAQALGLAQQAPPGHRVHPRRVVRPTVVVAPVAVAVLVLLVRKRKRQPNQRKRKLTKKHQKLHHREKDRLPREVGVEVGQLRQVVQAPHGQGLVNVTNEQGVHPHLLNLRSKDRPAHNLQRSASPNSLAM